ncbi:alpha/beta hydrolase [Microbacterium pygmaeum]|uniref:Acetyl esterase/lipase n=1 Tax=Microbacterium pygmaeum TaxID=370764 RepID=A0A1G7ZSE1_9MICO|nr:alpha/beta hydrolase [Microbacterium pygmaeum]SDH11594.1 Acetyl esterase/lipase [Microbacterium pygmaeum]
MTRPEATAPRPWYRRKRMLIPASTLLVLLAFATFAFVNPWPTALLIRAVFAADGASMTAEMQKHAPPAESLEAHLDVQYGPRGTGGEDTQLDLFSPADSTGALPTIVWIHGGAWLEGAKEDRDPYTQILAAAGYTVASLNYTLAPEATYPTAITQLNDALGFLSTHADRYRIDPDRLILAGDSAGAQLASQLATMITSPRYADLVGVSPAIQPTQLAGVILYCGVYDVSEIPNAPGLGGWGFRTALWAYLGTKDWADTPGGEQMSTIDDVTSDFPPTWISGGNADPLTATQSKPLAAKLNGFGVDVTELFFPDDTVPALGHEYQFHLDLDNAQLALRSSIGWLDALTAVQPSTD